MKYVLITAARNEERFIGKTLESVISQTRLPERWVIVDDGSVDRTGQIADDYAKRFCWIDAVHNPKREIRNFAAKANSVNSSLERMKSFEFEVVGNLDADTSFGPNYMQFLMGKFSEDSRLGVAGTPFTQDGGYDSTRDSFEGENYVAGPCQLFRRKCWEEIGGYIANPAGGVDWIAVMTARMKGWTVRSFSEMRYHHHRSMGTAGRGELAALYSYGQKDYYLGNSPIWQLFRFAYRSVKQPLFFGGLALMAGYSSAAIRRINRPVSPELMRFHRKEQMKKLRAILGSLVKLKKVDNFALATSGGAEDRRQKSADRKQHA